MIALSGFYSLFFEKFSPMLEVDNELFPLYMFGRYFRDSHYMSQLHPYSIAISLNKKEGRPYYGKFNGIFEHIYRLGVNRILKRNDIYGICSVPVKPGQANRYEKIVRNIAEQGGITDVSPRFVCIKNYPSQKTLSQRERAENVKDVFKYEGDLTNKNIIILDDIASTGSTMRACIRELKAKGANEIYIVVLAVNQLQGTYWSSEEIQVSCPHCNNKMRLLVNGQTGAFFYSCFNCRYSIDFKKGIDYLIDVVNDEFNIS